MKFHTQTNRTTQINKMTPQSGPGRGFVNAEIPLWAFYKDRRLLGADMMSRTGRRSVSMCLGESILMIMAEMSRDISTGKL